MESLTEASTEPAIDTTTSTTMGITDETSIGGAATFHSCNEQYKQMSTNNTNTPTTTTTATAHLNEETMLDVCSFIHHI